METSRTVEHELLKTIARKGWIGVTIPTCYGGLGLGHLAKTIIIEELSRESGAVGAAAQASMLGVAKILHYGNETQRARWLPGIAGGDILPTIAVTERESGGHVLDMRTSAIRDGEDYIINGSKIFVGNSHVADVHGVVARTGGPGSTASQALSAFLIEADRDGVRLVPHLPAVGLHGFSFGEIVFDDCRVPAVNRLGAEGDGRDVAYSSSVTYGRANLAAVALGLQRRLLEETAAYAARQHRSGRPLADLGVNRQRLGWMQSRLMTSRLALYHAADLLDRRLPCDAELINANLLCTEGALASANDAMRVHAACGLFPDRPIERYMRDAQCLEPPAGTSDIQLLRLSEFALGVERWQWSQRVAGAGVWGGDFRGAEAAS
jgi:alkylation response protein AidB-like acyl-CoA dehydrogenase